MQKESEKRLRQLFGPLVQWIGNHDTAKCPKKLLIHLIGPNVPTSAPRRVELSPCGHLEQVELHCQSAVYEHRVLSNTSARLLFSFHAGIWGYNEWRPTLQYLAKRRQKIYFVVTAYTLEEAEDDADVIQEEVSRVWHVSKEDLVSSACIWAPQANAFASKQDRDTSTAPQGRKYHENAAWQAWCL